MQLKLMHWGVASKKACLAGRWGRLLVTAVFVLILPALAQAEDEHVTLEHITLQLKWTYQFQFAGYYAAIEKGYYRDAGLDVRLREAVPGINPIQAVTAGSAEYGVGTTDLLLDRAQGTPVVVLGVIFQHSPFALIVHADSKVQTMKDLIGKRIILDDNSADIVAMLQRAGLPPDSYTQLEHNFKLDDWIQGKVDATDIYITNQLFELSQQGIAYRIFRPVDSGIDFYGDNLFTTEQEIRHHPKRTQAFLDASMKGWTYAMQHPDEIIQLIINKYHSSHTFNQLHFEANAMRPLLDYGMIPTGYMFDARWLDIVKTYQNLGMLPANFKLQGFLYHPKATFLNQLWSWRWQILVGSLSLVLMIIVIFVFSLRRAVQQRTVALQDARQQADHANASKSQFLAAASHDMRQPMQAMRLYLDVLTQRLEHEKPECEKAKCEKPEGEKSEGEKSEGKSLDGQDHYENIEIIHKISDTHINLSDILNSFLDISQLDSGVMQPQIKAFDVVALLHQVHEQYLPSASAVNLTFQLDAPAIEILVDSDPIFVKGVLVNLISNALRYTHKGGILLRVKKDESKACLEVWDNGPGIEKSKQDIIFEDFMQLDNPERNREKGVGLGLAIVSRICRQLGSHIQLLSTPGKGSVFYFDLPLALVLVPQRQEHKHDLLLNHQDLAGMLVFVIDDDLDVRDSLRMMLKQWQCEVKSFADKDELLQTVQSMPRLPDVILSDYRLPNNTTGIEVISQLRELVGNRIPALLLTGDTEPALMKSAGEAGLPMLIKPVEAHKLHQFLARIIHESP